jgi:hypothetical protein
MLVHDTWADRDLPVLDATVGLLEHSYMVTVTDIAAKTALDPSVVTQALDALDPVYVDFRKTTTGGDPSFWYVFKVTPEARRVVGQWPTAEALATRLADELAAAAREAGDGDYQGLLAYAARLIGDTLRDATVRAAAAVLAPAFGGIPVPELGQQVPPPAPREDADFESLVPLPELPELLRPDRGDSRDGGGSAPTLPDTPVAQESAVPSEAAALDAEAGDADPERAATDAHPGDTDPERAATDARAGDANPDSADTSDADPDHADTDANLVRSRWDAVG